MHVDEDDMHSDMAMDMSFFRAEPPPESHVPTPASPTAKHSITSPSTDGVYVRHSRHCACVVRYNCTLLSTVRRRAQIAVP